MPTVVGLDLQSAQNKIQESGVFWSTSHDLAGTRRQVLDSAWRVCTQNIAPGATVSTSAEGSIDLGVVRREESCPAASGAIGATGSSATKQTAPAANTREDKGFRLENVTFKNQEYIGPTATARITNTTGSVRSGMFNLSILDSTGAVRTSFVGAGNEVAPGQTVTVEFLSDGDKLPVGKVTYTFQTSTAYDS